MNEATPTKCLVALTEEQLFTLGEMLGGYREYLRTGTPISNGDRARLLPACDEIVKVVHEAIIPR